MKKIALLSCTPNGGKTYLEKCAYLFIRNI